MPRLIAASLLAALAAPNAAIAQTSDLAGYFGFEDPRIIVVDNDCGPALSADFNNDGLDDIAIVNNRKSRIEVYTQRTTERTDEELERAYKVNELKPNRFFDRADVSVAHRVTGFRAHDVNSDGMLDIIYAGRPSEVVVLTQESIGEFEELSTRRVRGLAAGQDGIEIAEVTGDDSQDLLIVASGKILVFELGSSGLVGEPTELGSSGEVFAFLVEDYDGDGRSDVMAALPEDDAPVRVWLQREQGGLGAETRFEMPAIIEAEPVRFPDRDAASIALIERASRRIILYDLTRTEVEPTAARLGAERDALASVYGFRGEAAERSVFAADIDQDGMLDLVATDPEANSLVMHKQAKGSGLGAPTSFSAFKDPKVVKAGQWDGSGALEVFVLSEEEKAVGIASMDSQGRLGFPQPISVATAGTTPVAMAPVRSSLVNVGGSERHGLAVVVRDRRDHSLELHFDGAETTTLELEGVNRPPQSILPGDFDADGNGDFLLFTPNEPLVMVHGGDEMTVLTDETMPQFGLVQAAGPQNTAALDIDGDGFDELLIADENFVRACSFDSEKGWRVVEQITTPEADASLGALAVLPQMDQPTIVAADSSGGTLVFMSRNNSGVWQIDERQRLQGFGVRGLEAGSFTGDGEPNVLAIGSGAFAIIRLAGEHVELKEVAVYRSDLEDRLEHELEVGDFNSDGFVDMVSLDAREQMCQIFTFSASRKMYFANEFKVFESRLFGAGGGANYEPSYATLGDFNNDGATDIALEVHDRFIIYPQRAR